LIFGSQRIHAWPTWDLATLAYGNYRSWTNNLLIFNNKYPQSQEIYRYNFYWKRSTHFYDKLETLPNLYWPCLYYVIITYLFLRIQLYKWNTWFGILCSLPIYLYMYRVPISVIVMCCEFVTYVFVVIVIRTIRYHNLCYCWYLLPYYYV